MRGEDSMGPCRRRLLAGSPPHARGRHPDPGDLAGAVGITPAYAGKTPRPSHSGPRRPDHPRMRGEGTPPGVVCLIDMGSPPHARGRPVARRCGPKCGGDHPRMRGEDRASYEYGPFDRGSPPHARGRPDRELSPIVSRRITPACAGKTHATRK